MIFYKPAKTEELDDLFTLIRDEAADYLSDTLEKIGLTEAGFRARFESVGQVFTVHIDENPAGFYWIEKRDDILHLHGIVICKRFQRQGYGRQVMEALEQRHGAGMAAIELGVYLHNEDARRFYERLGYQTVQRLEELQFDIMRRYFTHRPDG